MNGAAMEGGACVASALDFRIGAPREAAAAYLGKRPPKFTGE